MATQVQADVVLVKGKVLTMARKQPEAEALAIKGDRILAVGTTEDIKALAGTRTKVIDLRGKVVVPGFIDAHNHLARSGLDLLQLDLTDCKSLKSLLEAVRKRVKAEPEGSWIVGHGWDESKWTEPRYPNRDDLDAVAPHHPVYLRRVDGHLAVVNTLALGSLNVPLNAPGVLVDDTGKRSGVLTEHAVDEASASLPFHMEQAVEGLGKAAQEAFREGVTSVHHIADAQDIRVLRAAQRRGVPLPRVNLQMLHPLLDEAVNLGLHSGLGDDRVHYGGIKVYTDGSLGARTAAISVPYADQPGHGQLLWEQPKLQQLVEQAHAAGFQLALHAIGDRAISACLDALEAAVKKHPRKDHRHRIEHFEMASDENIGRAHKLGVIASVQPNFTGNWGLPGQMYEARLGKEAARGLNRLRVMHDMGLKLAFGSDNMPMGALNAIHWAVNGPNKEQRLEPEEALRAHTLDAAFAGFEEQGRGSIEPGKLADLAVLNGDPRAKPKEINKLRVDMTFLGGELVWKKP